MNLYPLLMAPCFRAGSETPWGGYALRDLFMKDAPDAPTGECLEVSCAEGQESAIASGAHAGKTLKRGRDYTMKYARNKAASTATEKATVTVTGIGDYKGSITKKFTIAKAANPLKAAGKTKAVSRSALCKGAVAVKGAVKLTRKAQGKVTYSITKALRGSKDFKRSFSINAKTGQITVKRCTCKGTYKISIKVSAKGNANYKSAAKTVTATIRVK